ncbi:hypothetical protein ABMA27_015931 [Loxostege sticticalis]|uniref:Delta-sarcoglycan n=1 Tax=Loxostege sticticalis TaxID=481309 RepID=A0ABR3I4V9_LOXSC
MSVEDRSASTSTGVIRGWGCTPTGDPPPAAVCETPSRATCLPAGLLRGWRRTCLYAIIVLLMVLVFLNIALTLWIIGTLRLNAHGIGPIKIIKNGIQLDGHAWIVDNLAVSTISSQPAQPVTVHSYRNFTVLVSEPTHGENNTSRHVELAKLLIKRDSVVCSGRKFEVRDAHGDNVFSASREEVRMSADTLAVDGVGGVTVKSAIQTPSVRAPPGSDLQLESLTRRLSLKAPQSIHFDSRAGSIDMTSHGDIKFDSIVGSIKIDAPNIVISNLKEASVTNKAQKNIRTMKVYQLCACASGKLFLASPDGVCVATDDELCR